jgi:hypothetical protein
MEWPKAGGSGFPWMTCPRVGLKMGDDLLPAYGILTCFISFNKERN